MHSDDILKDNSDFRLGEISGKIDLVLVQMAHQQAQTETRLNKQDERLDKQDTRLDTVEEDVASLKRDRAWVVGAAAAVSALGATVAGFLGWGK